MSHEPQKTNRSRILAAAVTVLCLTAPPARSAPSVINVEIDYMTGGTPYHSHRPSQAEINAVVQMFACHGITLNVVVDDSIPHTNVLVDGANQNDFFTATGPGTFQSIKSQFRDNGSGWHYCVFGHDYTVDGSAVGSSGIAEPSGDDFLVSLGQFANQIGTPFDRAATFAHELGHNLSLNHFGNNNQNAILIGNYQPNYASIMSYQYQLSGVRTQMNCLGLSDATSGLKDLDYSDGRMPTLDEAALSEVTGVGIHKVDWNCDGVISGAPVSQDLNGSSWCGQTGTLSTMKDYDDWANLKDTSVQQQVPLASPVPCITAEELKRLRSNLANPVNCPGAQPSLSTEACRAGQMVWVDPAYSGTETGTGDQPFSTFASAYSATPTNSVLFLQPGTYAGSILGPMNKRITLAGPGGATIGP